MIEGMWLWITLALIASTTLITRGSFLLLGEGARLPSALQRALRYAPAAALSALIVPDMLLDAGAFDPINPKLAAGVAAFVVTTRSRNPWLPFIAGMGLLLLMRKGLGW
ncbi:MAG TPA: AzlD domain-containing protein [Aromatoleum sp.]|uniref:AzlD domain-containing protein n=1 Tax=Aromatoleum sp. TaxID=2307007 RepID=UPI002B46815A|nr:AzlD domain-containing protein [Aromatoleum sp.]HJV24950.1 AzlD domain-containing protein [Aromatoleum sp.]